MARGLSAMLRKENAPGSNTLKECEDLEVLAKWYAEFGEMYLDRFKQE